MSTIQILEVFKKFFLYQKGNAKSTLKEYLCVINDFERFAREHGFRLDQVDQDTFLDYVTNLKRRLKPQTVNRYIIILRAFYNIVIDRGITVKNPVTNVRVKYHQEPKDVITEEEVDKILMVSHNNYIKKGILFTNGNRGGKYPLDLRACRDYLILRLLSETGIRIAELLELGLAGVNFGGNRISVVGKGNKRRTVPIPCETMGLLTTYSNLKSAFLTGDGVITDTGRLFDLTNQGVIDLIRFYLCKAEIRKNVTPHTFRHYFITRCHRAGMDLITIQNIVGHVNLNTTSRYTHPTIDTLQEEYNKIQQQEMVAEIN